MKQFIKFALTGASVAVGFFAGKALYDLTLKKAIENFTAKKSA